MFVLPLSLYPLPSFSRLTFSSLLPIPSRPRLGDPVYVFRVFPSPYLTLSTSASKTSRDELILAVAYQHPLLRLSCSSSLLYLHVIDNDDADASRWTCGIPGRTTALSLSSTPSYSLSLSWSPSPPLVSSPPPLLSSPLLSSPLLSSPLSSYLECHDEVGLAVDAECHVEDELEADGGLVDEDGADQRLLNKDMLLLTIEIPIKLG